MVISNEGILVILFVGLVAGWLAGKIVSGTGFGIIGDILGCTDCALLASLLFPKLGITPSGTTPERARAWSPRSSIPRSSPSSCW